MSLLNSILRQHGKIELTLQNYVGERDMRSKSGDKYTAYEYQFVDQKNLVLYTHFATKVEHLSGMRTSDRFGEALSSIPEKSKVTVELIEGKYPCRIWKRVMFSSPS